MSVFLHHIELVVFGVNGVALVLFDSMAIMHGCSWVVGMNGEFYRALGSPPTRKFSLVSPCWFIFVFIYE
jgi:hypothetical protein